MKFIGGVRKIEYQSNQFGKKLGDTKMLGGQMTDT